MSNEKYRKMLSAYIDHELSDEDRLSVEQALEGDPSLRKELEQLEKVKSMTKSLEYADIPVHVWEQYWSDLYRRIELGIGWVMLSISSIIFLACGAFYLVRDFFMSPEPPIIVKLGVGVGILGISILLVSLGRERLFEFKHSRYKGVIR